VSCIISSGCPVQGKKHHKKKVNGKKKGVKPAKRVLAFMTPTKTAAEAPPALKAAQKRASATPASLTPSSVAVTPTKTPLSKCAVSSSKPALACLRSMLALTEHSCICHYLRQCSQARAKLQYLANLCVGCPFR